MVLSKSAERMNSRQVVNTSSIRCEPCDVQVVQLSPCHLLCNIDAQIGKRDKKAACRCDRLGQVGSSSSQVAKVTATGCWRPHRIYSRFIYVVYGDVVTRRVPGVNGSATDASAVLLSPASQVRYFNGIIIQVQPKQWRKFMLVLFRRIRHG